MRKKLFLRLLLYGSLGVILFCFFSSPLAVSPRTGLDYYFLSKRMEAAGHFEAAEKSLKKAIKLDPELGKAYLMLGAVYVRLAQYSKAELFLKLSIDKLKQNGDRSNEERAYYNLGILYKTLWDPEQAWDFLVKAYQLRSPEQDLLWRSNDPQDPIHFVVRGEKQAYITFVRENSQIPLEVETWISRMRFYPASKKIRLLRQYIAENGQIPFLPRFQRALAVVLMQTGRLDEALQVLTDVDQDALSKQQRAAIRWTMVGVLEKKKDYKRALDCLDQLILSDPGYESVYDALWNKSVIFRKMYAVDQEIRLLERIQEKNEHSEWGQSARARLADIYLVRGQYRKSFELRYPHASVLEWSKWGWMGAFGALLTTGLFFIFHRVFFYKKIEIVRGSGYRLWHLFVLLLVSSGFLAEVMEWLFLSYDYYVFDLFSRLKINPRILGELVQSMCVLGWVFYLLVRRYKVSFHDMGLEFRGVKYDFGMGGLVCLLMVCCGLLYGFLLRKFGISPSPIDPRQEHLVQTLLFGQAASVFLVGGVLHIVAPIVEELTFRVFLLKYMEKYLNLKWAVVLSCFVFALGHREFFLMLALGGILTGAYLRTRSVVVCCLAHMFWNFAVLFSKCI